MVEAQKERYQGNKSDDNAFYYLEADKRRPSKYVMTERNAWNWLRHTQKLYNSGELKEDRIEKFEELLVLCEKYHHVNQYT